MSSLDFAGLNTTLIGHGIDLLRIWLPGGKKRGGEYICAGLTGGAGESLSVNLRTGAWAEFNGLGSKGGDLISLYAAIHGLTQGDAFNKLGGKTLVTPAPVVAPNIRVVTGTPPPGNEPPADGAEQVWRYLDATGALLFCVARYPGKQIRPWSWDVHQKRWVQKGWPAPRPLYGLDRLAAEPDAPVLIVEGEKAADAAAGLTEAYVCMTWPNGAAAVDAADWSVLMGRRILIWPDADEPGISARDKIIDTLATLATEIKYLVVADLPKGYDAADWVDPGSGWTAWAKPRVRVWAKTELITAPVVEPAAATSAVSVTLVEDHAPIPESVSVLCETYGLAVKGRSGVPICNIENAARALSVIPGYQGLLWWDEFYQSVRTDLPAGWIASDVKAPRMAGTGPERDWNDADTLGLTMRFQRVLGFQGMGSSTMLESVTLSAHQDRRSAVRDWMRSLVWDGQKRLDSWTENCLGLFYTHYNTAVGRNFFISLVARTMRPGCQADNMLVLEGKQGVGKSSLFNAIAGEAWYAEASESPNSKDFFQVLRGKLIVEVAELDAFGRADVTRIKQILSCRSDRYRESYGRISEDHPRRSVFVGTTNESSYLRDNTGARRFWPIEAAKLDLAWMRANREQLFAEAVAAYDAGATWWEVPSDEAQDQAESRRISDDWEGRIAEWAATGAPEFTLLDLAKECFGMSPKDVDRPMQFRLGHCLRAVGYKNKVKNINGHSTRVWVKE